MKQETLVKEWNVKTFATEFKSIREMIAYNDNGEHNMLAFRNKDSEENNYRFSQTNSYKEARELLMYGWSSGAQRLNTKLKIANKNTSTKQKQKTVYDVVGFQPSVPRYLQGIPTNMINKKNFKQKQKTMTLNKMIAYPARINPEQIMEDSVKFLQIVQEIEKQNIRVNVNVVFHSINGNEQILIKTKIKSANERLNIAKMSFPLIHPSFLRRIIFRTMEVEQRAKDTGWGSGYGSPGQKSDTAKHIGKDEILIPIMISEKEANDIISKAK